MFRFQLPKVTIQYYFYNRISVLNFLEFTNCLNTNILVNMTNNGVCRYSLILCASKPFWIALCLSNDVCLKCFCFVSNSYRVIIFFFYDITGNIKSTPNRTIILYGISKNKLFLNILLFPISFRWRLVSDFVQQLLSINPSN